MNYLRELSIGLIIFFRTPRFILDVHILYIIFVEWRVLISDVY